MEGLFIYQPRIQANLSTLWPTIYLNVTDAR